MSEEQKQFKQRKVQKASSRFLARERLPMFAGESMPATIVAKEMADNTVDVVAVRDMPATQASIEIGPNRVRVMDNGIGISTDSTDPEDPKAHTHLWLAMAEMFTSSNYEGETETIGSHGVGFSIATMTSAFATALVFPHITEHALTQVKEGSTDPRFQFEVKGYSFTDGYLKGTEEAIDAASQLLEHEQSHYDRIKAQLELNPEESDYKPRDLAMAKAQLELAKINVQRSSQDGDFVKNPMSLDQALEQYQPFFEDGGYMVDLIWPSTPNSIFEENIDVNWLAWYIEARIGEVKGKFDFKLYKTNDFSEENIVKHEVYRSNFREKGERTMRPNNVTSWEERVKEQNGRSQYVNDKYRAAFFTEELPNDFKPMVQGAPVQNVPYFNYKFEFDSGKATMRIPYSFYYRSEKYPRYTDQTKVGVRIERSDMREIVAKFEGSAAYDYFYRKAQEEVLKNEIADSETKIIWRALGPVNEAELIIGEGHSAISGVKAYRDQITQACVGIRGKIKNVWRSPMSVAIKSPIVKELLNEIMNQPYKRIIFAVDADDDGYSICTLLIGLLANYTNLIQEGRVFIVYTPHYIFRKPGEPIQWSEDPSMKPKGWSMSVNKGLGSLRGEDVETFITNKETRKLVKVIWDDETDAEALDFCLNEGGRPWLRDETDEYQIKG